MASAFIKAFPFKLTIMIKTLLTAFVVSGMLGFTAQAQTTPAGTAPTGNRTAGTTDSPVDPTSKTNQAVSGMSGQSNTAPDRSTTGNRTAGTTNNPVDPTSNPTGTTRSNNMSTRKTRKTKTSVSH
jgi:hypothetical protein